ncbi:hypothetical protein FG386_003021 [Cryptosporidium ryanae]|uniref:uncharacterized protein n=1 Tax=Cryptosporidium ryanae TaxID=515981 RepID=UPI00351A8E18|nr:hypothetical protein FG386_003021 [Cryptosporidium ryanae]
MLISSTQREVENQLFDNNDVQGEVGCNKGFTLKEERTIEDDTSVVENDEDDESDYQSIIDSFRFQRGLKLILEIPKETIKYIYKEKLDKHVQLPTLISFKDLCIDAYGEENVTDKNVFDGKKIWNKIITEKTENGEMETDENDNEDNEKTYKDITSFLDTIKSNSKNNSFSVSENVLRKRVHEMSTRLSKQGLLCDPREYYFNPMTMTGSNGGNRSKEDYYDVFDDFIDDSEMVDDLGLSLEDLYSKNDNNGNDDSLGSSSVQTSELIYADYTNPNAFYCDNDPQGDLIDFYYESDSDISNETDNANKVSGISSDNEIKKSVTIRDLLNNQILKLLIQLRTDCWLYYSPKNASVSKDLSSEQSLNNTQTNVVGLNCADTLSFSQETVDLSTPVNKETNPSSKYSFPQRTPRVVTYWFKNLNEKLVKISEAYNKCKSYYNKNGNVRIEKNSFESEIQDSVDILTSTIEKDPILCKVPCLFTTIYPNYEVVPFDSKLIQIIWQALNATVPILNKKRQIYISQGDSSSLAIINLLTKYDNFRIKWVRLVLNHNQEVLYQLDLNAYESIINYPSIKSKSPEYVKRILNSISQYNSQINLNSNSSKERDDSVTNKIETLNSTTNEIEASQETIVNPFETQLLDYTPTLIDLKREDPNSQQENEEIGISQLGDSNSSMQNNITSCSSQNEDNNGIQEKPKPFSKTTEFTLQSMKAVDCDLVLDYGVSLLEYIHGVNRLRLVYKDIISANVMTKTVQKEQDSLPVNGTRGLEQMIKSYILKRLSNVSFEGQKLKDIPHRYFLNQIKLLQLKYNYRSLTSITVRRPKSEVDSKSSTSDTTKKRKRKETTGADFEVNTKEPNKNCSKKEEASLVIADYGSSDLNDSKLCCLSKISISQNSASIDSNPENTQWTN